MEKKDWSEPKVDTVVQSERDPALYVNRKHPQVEDRWAHRAMTMRCYTCMFYVSKKPLGNDTVIDTDHIGRCRRHAPTMNGYPVIFGSDWCGDHKLDENKI